MEWKVENAPTELEAWDRYAAAALEIAMGHPKVAFSNDVTVLAKAAADIADALLQERRKRVQEQQSAAR